MKKVNIQIELGLLEDKKINVSTVGPTDGELIKKENMSHYIKSCYIKSIAFPLNVPRNSDYSYYCDKINKTCVLFTNTYIMDYNDEEEIETKDDTITVKIYTSNHQFMNGMLIQQCIYYFMSKFGGKWNHKNGIYLTDCKEFNEFPLIKDLRKLSSTAIINKKPKISYKSS